MDRQVLLLDDEQVGITADDHLVQWLLEGGWGGGPYSPKWTSTTYTLLHLMWLGIPPGHPAALRGCQRLWEWRERWRVPETCIVAMLIQLTSAYGYQPDRLDALVDHLLGQQLADGGWNCAARGDKNKHSSFHTTILALEALGAFARSGGRIDTAAASLRGREFFLAHRLYRSHRTGAVAIRGSTRFPAFPEWHFDVLRGLEHFATADHYDERLRDAVDVLCQARRKDGRWPTYAPYPGRYWFTLEPTGPSRWNTTRALRVLQWWSSHTPNHSQWPTADASCFTDQVTPSGSDEELSRRQAALHGDAAAVLTDLDLAAIVADIGPMLLTGSFVSHLMCWPELDVMVHAGAGFTPHDVLRLLQRIVAHPGVVGFDYRDERGPRSPTGTTRDERYHVPIAFTSNDRAWRIDLTLWLNDPHTNLVVWHETLRDTITPDQRSAVLRIKNVWHTRPSYPDQIGGLQIYTAVIDDGVRTPEQFATWLVSHGYPEA